VKLIKAWWRRRQIQRIDRDIDHLHLCITDEKLRKKNADQSIQRYHDRIAELSLDRAQIRGT
jgi:hypothetical protein